VRVKTTPVPRPFALYAYAVFLAGLVSLGLSLVAAPPQMSGLLALMVFFVAVAEVLAVELPNGGATSLSYPLSVATIVLMGPAAGGLVALVSGISPRDITRRRPLPFHLFNIGQYALSAVVAGWTYVLLGGRVLLDTEAGMHPFVSVDFPWMLVPLAACAAVSFLLNDCLTGMAGHFCYGISFKEAWVSGLAWMVPTQGALAVVGVSIAQVLAVSRLGFLLFVFPLVVARQVYQRYLTARDAYTDSIRSLVGALEAKDPYTRGHSERVAQYAVRIGTAMGLEPSDVSRLEHAALMHDLGKLAVPRSVLTKPGKLDDSEFALIRAHPKRGADIVSGIPYLEGLADYVRDHHERYDGQGYGRGIAAGDISPFARILAVADSYDAMTTKRQYRDAMSREEAARELVACAGTQFDPEVIQVFLDVLDGDTSPSAGETVARTEPYYVGVSGGE